MSSRSVSIKVLPLNIFIASLTSVTIAAEERGTNDIFVPAGVETGYAWNKVPIDGTDILRSIPTISRELHFLLGISLNNLPTLTQNNGQDILD